MDQFKIDPSGQENESLTRSKIAQNFESLFAAVAALGEGGGGGGGGGGGSTLIEAKTVAEGGENSVAFFDIPSTYRHLRLVVSARLEQAGDDVTGAFAHLSVNENYNGIYDAQVYMSNGGGSGGFGDNNQMPCMFFGTSLTPPGTFDYQTVRIGDYVATDRFKATYGEGAAWWDTGQVRHIRTAGRIKTLDLVTSLRLSADGVFVEGSQFRLYGE